MTNSEKLGKMFVLPKPIILHFLVYTRLYFPVIVFSLELSFFLCRGLSIHSSSLYSLAWLCFSVLLVLTLLPVGLLKKKSAFALADICSLSYLSG